MITTIVAFTSFPSLQTAISNTKCSIFYSLDVSINGDQSSSWGGFTNVQAKVYNISTLLGQAATKFNTLPNSDWLITSMNNLKQMNL
jgi:hypothetical protein